MKNWSFIYDPKTSRLFAADGTYLKTLSCPKGKDWQDLTPVGTDDSIRACQACGDKVINLDVMAPELAESVLRERDVCVYFSGSSQNVLILRSTVSKDSKGPKAKGLFMQALNAVQMVKPGTKTKRPFKIVVVGIGNAGVQVLNRIAERRLPGVKLVALDTDVSTLRKSKAVNLQIGVNVTKGLG